MPSCGHRRAVVRVLDQHRRARPPSRWRRKGRKHVAHQPRLERVGGEGEAEAGERRQPLRRQANAGHRSDDRRPERHLMHEVRRKPPVDGAHLQHGSEEIQRIGAAAPPRQRMQREAFRLDGCAAVDHAGRHMHLVAGLARRPRHRQAVREEIPVFGNEIEDCLRHQRICLGLAQSVGPTGRGAGESNRSSLGLLHQRSMETITKSRLAFVLSESLIEGHIALPHDIQREMLFNSTPGGRR